MKLNINRLLLKTLLILVKNHLQNQLRYKPLLKPIVKLTLKKLVSTIGLEKGPLILLSIDNVGTITNP